ncbi:MAG: aminotransferase class I/II-fold pyridoxal phosphate-dependent enzyme [Treponema sp.]|nr:aminotransferase class I/II-fold pyridoxal phosphate-dependent enzyme [Treponema sp.]
MLNKLAQDLNSILKDTAAEALFSQLGHRMYFPNGIIAQSAEAKKKAAKANGTIGMTVINGTPAILPSIKKDMPCIDAGAIVAYTPTAGNIDLRKQWREQIIEKNPLLASKGISLPIVVTGLTAGISYIVNLFCDETKPLLTPAPAWDNYAFIAEAQANANLHQFPLFNNSSFNIAAFEKCMYEEVEKYNTVRLLLNFPQNPSGYSPTHDEVMQICKIIQHIAEQGAKLLIICDDAYFGLNYEDSIEKQSLFAYLADIHENVLAVKIDGPTKEDFVWGFRCGFLTFASKNLSDVHYGALEKKVMGLIRASVSCNPTLSQTLLMRAYADPMHQEQQAFFRKTLERRYCAVKSFVNAHSSSVLTPLPFNSGYFMSFHVAKIDAEDLRKQLLSDKGIGTIAIDNSTLRVAFSSIDEDKIESVYSDIYETAENMEHAHQ